MRQFVSEYLMRTTAIVCSDMSDIMARQPCFKLHTSDCAVHYHPLGRHPVILGLSTNKYSIAFHCSPLYNQYTCQTTQCSLSKVLISLSSSSRTRDGDGLRYSGRRTDDRTLLRD